MAALLPALALAGLAAVTAEHRLQCSSLPSFDNSDLYIYFGCVCEAGSEQLGGVFSIAQFAHQLSHQIRNKSLVMDFRDCLGLSLLLDQELLYWRRSPFFRPDLSIVEVNVDNVKQVNLLPGALEPSTNVSEYVLPEVLETMAVHLYAVGEVAVGREVPLDLVTTEQPGTRLTINTTEAGGFHFRVEGFREENIRLVKPGASSPQHQDLAGWWVLEGWVLGSRQVSLWLAVSVLTVSLGIGTMTLALVRRHRLAIETALYGSIGSLRRLRGKKRSNSGAKPGNSGEEASNSNSNSSNLTTATEVAFFPRYSVVNKSWREEKGGKKKNEEKEKDNGKPVKDEGKTAVAVTEEAEQQKPDSKRVESAASNKSRSSSKQRSVKEVVADSKQRSVKEVVADSKQRSVKEVVADSKQRSVKEVVADSKQSLYEIISTIKFKSQQSAPASKAREPQQRRAVEPHQTSFYFQGGNQSSGSSKYDLTLARTLSKKIEAQVHQPNYVASKKSVITVEAESGQDQSASSSPAPLLKERVEREEGLYSFNTLREKCRQLIASSKPLHTRTKL